MDQAEKMALVRALQECAEALGLGNNPAPADVVKAVTAAIGDAERRGAEAMREAIAHQAEINALYGVHSTTVSTIRAMPLPGDSRAHGERHGTATPGQRAAQLEAIDEFDAAKRGER